MPVEFGLWRIDGSSRRVSSAKLSRESRIEDLIVSDPRVLDTDLLVLGQQVHTDNGKRIDILGIDADGDLHVVEVKRDRTPREVVAQALDYASWVRTLGYDDISDIFESDSEKEFESAFGERFNSGGPAEMSGPPEDINQNHSLTIVASELDSSTERIVRYLSEEYAVPINALFFNYYEDDGREYVARSWLVDPHKSSEPADGKEPWNGEFYANFGDGVHRSWDDAREYGFISAGQGRVYSRPLENLRTEAIVYVYDPDEGYIGVGKIMDEAVPVTEFKVEHEGEKTPILDAPLDAEAMNENAEDPELCEYVVGVDWIDTKKIEEAIWETGMFAIPTTACKFRNQFTIDRLNRAFDITDEESASAND